MTEPAPTTTLSDGSRSVGLHPTRLTVGGLALLLVILVWALASPQARLVAGPVVAVGGLLFVFVATLWSRDGRLPVLEIGSVSVLITSLYAAIPLLGYWLAGLRWSPASDYRLFSNPPTTAVVAGIGWRYVLYLGAFVAAYLGFRGRGMAGPDLRVDGAAKFVVAGTAAGFASFFLAVSLVYGVSSNPSYAALREGTAQAWAGLPYVLQQVASYGEGILLVSKLCLLAIFFHEWRRPRWRAVLVAWLLAETLTTAFRLGARRDVAMLLIAAILLYHRLVKPLSVGLAAATGGLLLVGLLAFGYLRDLHNEETSWAAANEFQILLGNACDLQARLEAGLEVPPEVYWSEALRLVPNRYRGLMPLPFLDPSDWYLRALGYDDDSTGLMFGIVAQSLIGWDWLELALRGAAMGLILAGLHRWYVCHAQSLWATAFYIFICVWCYYTVRSTSLHILYFVVYRFLPAIVLLGFGRSVLRAFEPRGSEAAMKEEAS